MIITIDGPAGSGKSTVAKMLACRLSELLGHPFEYLDTGSMYRAATLLGMRAGVDWERSDALASLAESAEIGIIDGRTFLNGEDVTDCVRQPEITHYTRFVADNACIRQKMVDLQRAYAFGRDIVSDGRDQGTVVFPGADCKFYLTATLTERATRRLGELAFRGVIGDFEEIREQIRLRDERDMSRAVGPLCEPADSIRIVSDGLTVEEVVSLALEQVLSTKKPPSQPKPE